ncbi:MAG: PBSX family phage terminase large subunit [Muribaculaceae bacterium]|nr:PBSX family phage terminase large subunit [Muribaculaceae bacterium]
MTIPHNQTLDVAIYQGGYGSGKTWCGSLLGILLARKYPGCRGLVGAKEYELVRKTTLVSYLEHLEALGYKQGVHYTYNKVDKIIKFKNGSEILFSQLDNPEKFKSLNLHWAEIEEASQVTDNTLKQLLGRLRNTYRGKNWGDFKYRLFGHTNPQPNKDWIYKRFVEDKQENYRIIIAPTTNNIYLPEHFVKELESAYDPEYYRINVLGEHGDYNSGLVVKGFTDENIKELRYVPGQTIHLTCDFNVDPMMWCLAHRDNENVFYFDEVVVENATTEICMKEFIRRYPNRDEQIIINGDASGDNRSTQSQYTNYATMRKILRESGYKNVKFHLRDYNPPIQNRVAAFNARVRNSNGEVRLFVDKKKCKHLLNNIHNLKYKEGTTIIDTPTIHQIKQDRDKKFYGHIFDAASYLTEYYWRIK